jgi:amino acid transporter
VAYLFQATTVVPRAMLSGVGVAFLLSFVLAFSVSSQYPGITEVEESEAPMNYGFADMFNIPEAAATVFSLFAVFGSGLAHMFAFTRQIQALARSRLCSTCFKFTVGFNGTPTVAILAGSVLSYCLLILAWAGLKKEVHILLHASLVFSFIGYLIIFASFLVFKISFTSMQRKFTNPFGYFSVAYGASVFLLATISILAFEEGHTESEEVCGAVGAALFLYYYFVASKCQTYSKEEQHLLLKLYVIKGESVCDGMFLYILA